MELEITLPASDPSVLLTPLETIIKKYLRFDENGACIGTGCTFDDTLPEDGTWCTDEQLLSWENMSLINGILVQN